MSAQKKKTIAKLLSLVVTLSGILVIIGWIFNIGILKSVSPAWISMKFDTAVAFAASGVSLYFIARAGEDDLDISQVVLSITSLIIVLLMGVLFFSALLGVRSGVEDLFIRDTDSSVWTVDPGQPSFPTIVSFLLIAVAGVFTLVAPSKSFFKLKVIGGLVAAIGLLAIAGYLAHAPVLYFYIPGVNSAMAMHTSILFVLTGIGLLCL